MAPAETHHYRKAAERVGVSQPSLSQQIAGLETALGLDLVERGHRGAVLTSGGREVLAQTRKIPEEAAVLRALAKNAGDGISGTIRLGATPGLDPCFLPWLMRRLHRALPSLKVVAREAAAVALQQELLQGPARSDPDPISGAHGGRAGRAAVSRAAEAGGGTGSPAGRQGGARDGDLAGQDIPGISSNPLLHERTVALCEALGANLRQEYEGRTSMRSGR